MNSRTLELIVKEFASVLTRQRFGKVYQLGRGEFAFDLRLDRSRYLFISIQPGDPTAYLITRRLKDLERASGNLSPFSLTMRKQLSGAEVLSVRKLPQERVIEIEAIAEDETGLRQTKRLLIQLTGRSANLFLTNAGNLILDRARDTLGEGQQIGDRYAPPLRSGPKPNEERVSATDAAVGDSPGEPSAALDAFYTRRSADLCFASLARSALAKVAAERKRRDKLIAALRADLAAHGEADEWKRTGDLLLSNVSTATREGGSIVVTDYFDESLPRIAIEAEENESVTEAAERYFRRYTKARNAAAEIAGRLETLAREIEELDRRRAEIDRAVVEKDTAFLEEVSAAKPDARTNAKRKAPEASGFARRFISSDGFEILVGKRAKDNDVLTFKAARSLDTWMHAADYPGSHVVIRNPNRKEIPKRTLYEAARLAAFYSQGRSQVKAAVHYTQKKFVNKPKGAAPGLVSLASFKTLLVAPEVPESIERRDSQ